MRGQTNKSNLSAISTSGPVWLRIRCIIMLQRPSGHRRIRPMKFIDAPGVRAFIIGGVNLPDAEPVVCEMPGLHLFMAGAGVAPLRGVFRRS